MQGKSERIKKRESEDIIISRSMGGECDCGSEGVSTTRRESAYDMIRVEAAVDLVLQHATPLETVALAAHKAVGYVLAEPVLSTVSAAVVAACCVRSHPRKLVHGVALFTSCLCSCGSVHAYPPKIGAASSVPSVDHGWVCRCGCGWGRRGSVLCVLVLSRLAPTWHETHRLYSCILRMCVQFPVVERIAAGDAPDKALVAGQVAYITTGSPVPEGADAVVKIEDTEGVYSDEAQGSGAARAEVAVKILKGVKIGQNIRGVGSDIMPGELLVDAHELVTSAEIGLLATVSGSQEQLC